MYAAELNGQREQFQVSGSLWRDALVMMNVKDSTLWSQINGECIKGDRVGEKLELFYSSQMTFAQFKEKFPEGQLLKKDIRGPQGSNYSKYFADDTSFGIFGHKYKQDRIPSKEIIYGLRPDCGEIAVTTAYMKKNPTAEIECGDDIIVIAYDSSTDILHASFKNSGEPLPVVTAYWFAWHSFFSETQLLYE